MMKAGELGARVKELEVSLEMAELSKQNAEKDCALAKDKAESSALEVKRLELMVISTQSNLCYFFSLCIDSYYFVLHSFDIICHCILLFSV